MGERGGAISWVGFGVCWCCRGWLVVIVGWCGGDGGRMGELGRGRGG